MIDITHELSVDPLIIKDVIADLNNCKYTIAGLRIDTAGVFTVEHIAKLDQAYDLLEEIEIDMKFYLGCNDQDISPLETITMMKMSDEME